MRFVYLIAALFLACLNLRPVITSVSPLLRTIQDSLGMSGAEASLLTSPFMLCMGFFAPAAVKLSNRLSIERTIAYCLLLIGLATAARYYAYSAWLMLLTAFLMRRGHCRDRAAFIGFYQKELFQPIGDRRRLFHGNGRRGGLGIGFVRIAPKCAGPFLAGFRRLLVVAGRHRAAVMVETRQENPGPGRGGSRQFRANESGKRLQAAVKK